MATIVPSNPFDTQPQAAATTGLVGGAIANGTTQGSNAAQSTSVTAVPNAGATTYNAQTREVDRATETAAGQVESLLAKDNPLMQRARTLATQGMNKRGLVNSSMTQGAGVAAMIDRITPIAQQDAQTFSNQSLNNQKTLNDAGQFNASEINKFGLQKSDQAFTSSENTTQRTFTAEQTKAAQDFQSAQSQLDRAQQLAISDKGIEAQKALQTAQQVFQGAQSELDRVNQKTLQESQQTFTSGQNALDRTQQTNLATAAQTFQASQSELDRAAQIMLADKNITANQALEAARQEFQKTENVADRTQQTTIADKNITANQSLQTAQQTFTSAQSELDRAQQTSINDKSIAANQALETAKQVFSSAQSNLDRAQQTNIAQAQITANQSLETARQAYQATQNTLDRTQQENMVKLTDSLNQAGVSKTFAGNLTLQTSTAINAISADPNLSSVVDPATGTSPKKAAIDNAIANANNTMQWGSTFYNTTLPKIAAPGGTAGVVTPGAGAGGGAPAPYVPAAPAAAPAVSNPNPTQQSGAYDWWKSNGGVTAMYDAIGQYLSTNPTTEQLNNYMQTYKVSGADIAQARHVMATTYAPAAPAAPAPAPVVSAPAPTRQQVLDAYKTTPGAEANPSEQSIAYWQSRGLDAFDQSVTNYRLQNPDEAARIDAERVYTSQNGNNTA